MVVRRDTSLPARGWGLQGPPAPLRYAIEPSRLRAFTEEAGRLDLRPHLGPYGRALALTVTGQQREDIHVLASSPLRLLSFYGGGASGGGAAAAAASVARRVELIGGGWGNYLDDEPYLVPFSFGPGEERVGVVFPRKAYMVRRVCPFESWVGHACPSLTDTHQPWINTRTHARTTNKKVVLHADGGHRDGRARAIDLPTFTSPSPFSLASGNAAAAANPWGATAARWRRLVGAKGGQGGGAGEEGEGGAGDGRVTMVPGGGTRLLYFTQGGGGLSVLEMGEGREGATHLLLKVRSYTRRRDEDEQERLASPQPSDSSLEHTHMSTGTRTPTRRRS